mgnify:CR=1 FL=1
MTIYNSITELVGKTPVIKLNSIVPEGSADVYVKLEAFNPGSSVKDRIALRMIEDAEKAGTINLVIPLLNQLQVTLVLVSLGLVLLKAIKLLS